jgi:hypothetical protein
LTVGVSDKVIENPIANRRDDAFLLVRQKKLSFIQADDAKKSENIFVERFHARPARYGTRCARRKMTAIPQ